MYLFEKGMVRMEKTRFTTLGVSVFICCVGDVFGEYKTNVELSTNYVSKYIWRGQKAVDDPVLQQSISLNYKGFKASIWGNLDLTNINGNNGEFSEIDYTIDYSGDLPGIEGIGYSIGAIFYDFPVSDAKDTSEVYWGLSADLPLSPSVTVYHDLDEADGTYVSLEAGHRIEKMFELGPGLPVPVELGATLGWGSGSYNKYYWGTDQTKLNDLAFSISFPIEIWGCTLVPSLNYVTLVSDDIRDTDIYGTDSDFFVFSVGLLKRF